MRTCKQDHDSPVLRMRPSISVALTTYNQARYIEAALELVFKHTPNPPLEVVVVDDRTTDETPRILFRFGFRA